MGNQNIKNSTLIVIGKTIRDGAYNSALISNVFKRNDLFMKLKISRKNHTDANLYKRGREKNNRKKLSLNIM